MQKRSPKAGEYARSILIGVALGILLAGVFAAGFFFHGFVTESPLVAASSAGQGDYSLLTEVQALLDRHYLREQPSQSEREYAAIRGMLGSLQDRYTFFIDPPVAASESDVLAGTYGGIGVQVQRSETGDLLVFPFEDSPAAAAGIEGGDILIAVNSAPVNAGMSLDTIDQMLRGEVKEDSGVEITVVKADGSEYTTFILFDVINVPSVLWRVLQEDPVVGYVQIQRFTSRTPEELTTALTELAAAGVDGLVIDLRDNSGGLLQESIAVADQFVDGGVLAYERDNQRERSFAAESGGLAIDLPLAILVNERTASGAELVAGAIRDNDRGIRCPINRRCTSRPPNGSRRRDAP
jgi:carboxyl-terminal processing protease